MGRPFSFAVLALFGALTLSAEDGILVLSVVDPESRPISNVRISTQGDGSAGISDTNGKIRLVLPKGTAAGGSVGLVLTDPPGLTILSPWNRRTTIPAYHLQSEFVEVVVCPHKCRAAITSPKVMGALLARINMLGASEPQISLGAGRGGGAAASGRPAVQVDAAQGRRATAAKEVVAAFDFSVDEFNGAAQELAKSSTDLFFRGMYALYRLDYKRAIDDLTLVARADTGKAQANQAGAAAYFQAQAYSEQGMFAEAVSALRRANQLVPADPLILNGLGSALIRGGNTAEGLRFVGQSSVASGRGGGL